MEYTELLIEADSIDIIVRDKKLLSSDGRIAGNRIALRKDLDISSKTCVLAEELGHHYTTAGNILSQSTISDRKQEYRARLWAYNKLVGLGGIIRAFNHGCRDKSDMADYLEITEEFLIEAIVCYKSKYGICTIIDNYMVSFDPLGVFELYK